MPLGQALATWCLEKARAALPPPATAFLAHPFHFANCNAEPSLDHGQQLGLGGPLVDQLQIVDD
eukprot:8602498-Pyramimonas_sp.AAC.1